MSEFAWMMIDGFAEMVVTAGMVVTGAMLQQGQVIMPTNGVLVLAGITGVVAFANHIRALRKSPPAP